MPGRSSRERCETPPVLPVAGLHARYDWSHTRPAPREQLVLSSVRWRIAVTVSAHDRDGIRGIFPN